MSDRERRIELLRELWQAGDNPEGTFASVFYAEHVQDETPFAIEIPKFNKNLAELETPLDFWLYFLKNGEQLDADALPAKLDREPGIRKAMGIVKMFTQNDMERELTEGFAAS
jgi:hypothetical protein